MENSKLSLFDLPGLVSHYIASTWRYFSRFKSGLSLRLLFVVVSVALIGILSLASFMLTSLRQQYIEQIETSTARSNRMLVAGLEHDMLTHDTAMQNAVIQDIAEDFDGERIQIIDQNNTVRGSSLPGELGQVIQQSSPVCQTCHKDGKTQPVITQQVIGSPVNGVQTLLSANPILNQPECNSCHDPQVKTLGVLVTQTPLADLGQLMQDGLRRIATAGFVTFSILVGLMVPALRKTIIEPIGELSKGIAEVGAENLDYPVREESNNELGQLARAFNVMREHLKDTHTAMLERSQELALLYDVALVTGQLLDLEKILYSALDTVLSQFDLEVGLIYLRDSTKNRFEVVASRGLSPGQLAGIEQKRQTPGGDLTLMAALTRKVHFIPDVSKDHHFVGDWDNPKGRSYINVPLISQGKVVGTLELTSRVGQPMTERQVKILTAVGHQIGIAIDNNSLLTETERNAREALTLYQLGADVSSSLELDQVLDTIAKGARVALSADIGVVGLYDQEHHELIIKSASGVQPVSWRGRRIPAEDFRLFKSSEAINLQSDSFDLPAPFMELLKNAKITNMLAVPLLRGEQAHGVVAVLSLKKRVFSKEDTRLLTRLAQQVVVAIENARLYQQVRYVAVLEERDRLGREMHDDLAQSLGYLNLRASVTGDLLASGNIEQARASLQDMKQVTRNTYTDTREAIFNLRNAVSLNTDLVPALRQYLADYSAHYGLDAQLVIEDGSQTEFKEDVTLQLSRIIQEALTNTRKHAYATRAWIRFEPDGSGARIVVDDNGNGFDPATAQPAGNGHYGLQIMHERAESFGGSVEFIPELGHGTRVVIHVPATGCK
jgi:nitrate/nitrite-specific signal transduction histidine kinase